MNNLFYDNTHSRRHYTLLKARIALIILLMAITLPGAMATNPAEQVLDRIEQWCKAKKSVTVDYTVTSGNETFDGKMIVAGNRFAIQSALMDTWFDGTTQWTYNPSANEVNISEPTDDEIQQINPFAIIDAFRNAYNIRLGESSQPNPKFDLIVMTPKDAKADISRVEISVAKGASYPSRIVLRLASGETCILNMKLFVRGTAYSNATFTYNPELHPKAQVVDLR